MALSYYVYERPALRPRQPGTARRWTLAALRPREPEERGRPRLKPAPNCLANTPLPRDSFGTRTGARPSH